MPENHRLQKNATTVIPSVINVVITSENVTT
jgi:hypothetical protein